MLLSSLANEIKKKWYEFRLNLQRKRASVPDWSRDEGSGLYKRKYEDYGSYLDHQASKLKYLNNILLDDYDRKFSMSLKERLERDQCIRPGTNALCLAARIGSEVKAFHALGCFAIGVDLNPGEHNRLVVEGDFHDLQFPDDSADIIFTNSLDHSLDFDCLFNEIKRVLKGDGLLIIEASKGQDEGTPPSAWEVLYWNSIDDLIRMIEKTGFHAIKRQPVDYPWHGEHIVFTPAPDEMPP